MKLIRDNRYTTIEFDPDKESPEFIAKFENELGKVTGVRVPGYEKSAAYKSGYWDGYTRLYEKSKHRLPDGLYSQLENFIEALQERADWLTYEVIDNKDELFMEEDDIPDTLTFIDKGNEYSLFDYQYNSVKEALINGRGILHLSVNSGKTGVSVALIKEIAKYLEKGEKVMYFVPTIAIFNQALKTMRENFGEANVGYLGDSKKKISKINVVIMLSMVSALKDPTQDKAVKITGKARTLQIFIEEVAPMLENANPRLSLVNLAERYQPETKARAEIKQWLDEAVNKYYTNGKVLMFVNGKKAEFRKIVMGKIGPKYKKYEDAKKLLEDTRAIIVDEGHHSKSDTTYETLLKFSKAPYIFAMTGSIDKKDQLSNQRLKGLYERVLYTVSNDELIKRGISAKPTINLINIKGTLDLEPGEDKNFQAVYTKGVVLNEDRNKIIVGLTQKMYEANKTSLLIVNRIEHGDILLDMFNRMGLPAEFISGATPGDVRERVITDVTNDKLKILIATNIFDEGVSINNIDALFMVSSTKSLRLVLQRVGRVLRKKKKGENKALVFDFVDMTHQFLKHHASERQQIYRSEGFEMKHLN